MAGKYLSRDTLNYALDALQQIHMFYMTTFLVCKRGSLPIGEKKKFLMDKEEQKFLDQYFRPIDGSEYYIRLSAVQQSVGWVGKRYQTSLNHTRLREDDFKQAFLAYQKRSNQWGWALDYVAKLSNAMATRKLPRISALALATWLFREREWAVAVELTDVIETFFHEFNITKDERDSLFDSSIPPLSKRAFQDTPVSWAEIQNALSLSSPPAMPVTTGGILDKLAFDGVGPAQHLEIDFRPRTNLITGDNGLGKTFILEGAWWALTNEWTGYPITPSSTGISSIAQPKITYSISPLGSVGQERTAVYDWQSQRWSSIDARETLPGLIIYAQVDGAFAVWDPARMIDGAEPQSRRALVLSRDDVWDGLSVKQSNGKVQFLCNGLIEDWVFWQTSNESGIFDTLTKMLAKLSPPDEGDLGKLIPGSPVRLSSGGTRRIPTLRHPYSNNVPITQASAGVRRIASLAYLIVWAWEEHKTQSALKREPPQRNLVILIDEVEAHLHPQWQRVILPALLEVNQALDAELDIQFIMTTHSPLVLTSLQPLYDEETDAVFHLNLANKSDISSKVILEKPDFVFGSVESWLRSDFFEMNYAGSLPAEHAINVATKFMQESGETPDKASIRKISERLTNVLGAHERFWVRWTYFASQHGVEL
jgi:hypothetical protein